MFNWRQKWLSMCSTTSCSLPFLKCWNSTGSPWEFLRREPKTTASVHREPLPWHICTGEGDLSCFGGKQDLRSQHLLSSLALWVLEARRITTVWLKIYTLSDMFSLIFSKPYRLHFAESCLRWGSGSCLNCFATVFHNPQQLMCGFLINVFSLAMLNMQ